MLWLDSWSGIGHVAVGMAARATTSSSTRYDEKGWRATFYTTGMEHSPTSATGTGWERTPWHATQRAAWAAAAKAYSVMSWDTFLRGTDKSLRIAALGVLHRDGCCGRGLPRSLGRTAVAGDRRMVSRPRAGLPVWSASCEAS